jgi:hypothetical protein
VPTVAIAPTLGRGKHRSHTHSKKTAGKPKNTPTRGLPRVRIRFGSAAAVEVPLGHTAALRFIVGPVWGVLCIVLGALQFGQGHGILILNLAVSYPSSGSS